MTLWDMATIASLVVFVGAWWMRALPMRRLVLALSALVALAASLAGVMTERWQNAAGAVIAVILLLIAGLAVLRSRKAAPDQPRRIPFVSGPLVTLLAALPALAILAFPVWPLPKPSGEHPVGVRTFEIADASRRGVFGAKPDEARRLLVRVWYPAASVAGSPAPYFSKQETRTTGTSLGRLLGFPPFLTYLGHVRTNSYPDAPLLAGAANLPVVLYSHGYTSFLGQNTALMEHLASHGYVVFSVQHAYDSSDTVFPNGDVAPMDAAMSVTMSDETRPSQEAAIGSLDLDERIDGALAYQEYAVRQHDRIVVRSGPIWVADRLFLHDALQNAPPQSVADIAAASNLARVGETGMSFGGAVSGEICMIDTRCAAGVNIDGGNFPFTAFNANVNAPFLMLHSDLRLITESVGRKFPDDAQPRGFNEFSYERLAEAGDRADVYRVSVRGARHLGMSDFSLFMAQPLRGPILGGGPSRVMIDAQNDFVLGFLDKHLRGQSGDFPAPQLAAHAGWVTPVPNADVKTWWLAKTDAERAALEARIAQLKPRYGPAAGN